MTLSDSVMTAPFDPPVQGLCTTRAGGVGKPPFDTLNLGDSCGDDPAAVAANRARLRRLLPGPPRWLRQVHGDRVIHLDDWSAGVEADAAWTDRPGQVAGVLVADCLPILVAGHGSACVAAIHAGWRGLAAGVIARTVAGLPVHPGRLQAWIGPRICQQHYEVGPELRRALPVPETAFEPCGTSRWFADLARIATHQLRDAGVGRIGDSRACTAEGSRFFSYRREGRTGRMAACIWIDPESPDE